MTQEQAEQIVVELKEFFGSARRSVLETVGTMIIAYYEVPIEEPDNSARLEQIKVYLERATHAFELKSKTEALTDDELTSISDVWADFTQEEMEGVIGVLMLAGLTSDEDLSVLAFVEEQLHERFNASLLDDETRDRGSCPGEVMLSAAKQILFQVLNGEDIVFDFTLPEPKDETLDVPTPEPKEAILTPQMVHDDPPAHREETSEGSLTGALFAIACGVAGTFFLFSAWGLLQN